MRKNFFIILFLFFSFEVKATVSFVPLACCYNFCQNFKMKKGTTPLCLLSFDVFCCRHFNLCLSMLPSLFFIGKCIKPNLCFPISICKRIFIRRINNVPCCFLFSLPTFVFFLGYGRKIFFRCQFSITSEMKNFRSRYLKEGDAVKLRDKIFSFLYFLSSCCSFSFDFRSYFRFKIGCGNVFLFFFLLFVYKIGKIKVTEEVNEKEKIIDTTKVQDSLLAREIWDAFFKLILSPFRFRINLFDQSEVVQ